MALSKQQKVGLVLLIVVTVSSISLVDATTRYVGFFNALANIELRRGDLTFVTTQRSLNITIKLKIVNPTSYRNLLLNGMSGTVFYEGENHTVVVSPGGPRSGTPYQAIETNLWELPESYVSLAQPMQVPPYSTSVFSMNVTAKGETAETFSKYYEKVGQQNIRWQLALRVSLTTPTFLGIMELQYDLDH